MREILVDWSTPSGGGKVSVLYFDETSGTLAYQRGQIKDMITAFADRLDNSVTWSVRTSGRTINEVTGALTGEWSDTLAASGTGLAIDQPVPDAAQILLRWSTGVVVGGRFLKGRTFVPGCAVGEIVDGNLRTAAVTDILAAQSAFLAASPGFGVWHRPVGGAGGQLVEVVAGSVWSELAVLRQRRV